MESKSFVKKATDEKNFIKKKIDEKAYTLVKPSGGLKSEIWKYFSIILNENEEKINFIICNKCDAIFSHHKHVTGTTSLLRHMKLCEREWGKSQASIRKMESNMGELLSVKWDQHIKSVLNSFHLLRAAGSFSDVTLACDGKLYKVHKIVLTVFSDYFVNIFEEVSSPNPVVILRGTSSDDLEALLDYMYLGEVKIEKHKVNSFLKSGQYLQVKGLTSQTNRTVSTKPQNKRSLTPDHFPCISKKSKKDANHRKSAKSGNVTQIKKESTSDQEHETAMEEIFIEGAIFDPYFNSHADHISTEIIATSPSKCSPSVSSSPKKSKSLKRSSKEDHSVDNDTYTDASESDNNEADPADMVLLQWNSMATIDTAGSDKSLTKKRIDRKWLMKKKVEEKCTIRKKIEDKSYTIEKPSDTLKSIIWKHFSTILNENNEAINFIICNKCQAIFSHTKHVTGTTSLLRHIKTCEGDEEPTAILPKGTISVPAVKPCCKLLICQYCSEKFVNSAEIEAHVHGHTDNKPFMCPHCPERDSLEQNVVSHLNQVHDDDSTEVLETPPQWRLTNSGTGQVHHLVFH